MRKKVLTIQPREAGHPSCHDIKVSAFLDGGFITAKGNALLKVTTMSWTTEGRMLRSKFDHDNGEQEKLEVACLGLKYDEMENREI